MKTLLLFILCAFSASATDLGRPVFLSLLTRVPAGGGGSSTNPADYGTVFMDIDPSVYLGNLSQNGKTNQLWDNSGNFYHGYQTTTASQPTFQTNVNGNPCLAFDGDLTTADNDFYYLSNKFSATLSGGATLFWTFSITNDPPVNTSQSGFGRYGSDTSSGTHVPFTDGNIYTDIGSTARKTVGNPSRSLTNIVTMCIVSLANDWRLYIDNTLIFSTGTSTVGWDTAPQLGAERTAITAAGMSGLLWRHVVFQGGLSDANRTNWNNVMATRYGSQIN